VVDLAAATGGNCAATQPDEVVRAHGVQVHGPTNLPATLPDHASQMLARTFLALLDHLSGEDAAFAPDEDDEIFRSACVARGGEVTNDRIRAALEAG
jgi:NAD(P) transhydrogenase subunit alpha